MSRKNIGIIGGMGPLATCDLMQKILMATQAGKDQEFPHILVDCNTEIPDRTACILHGGESPLGQMLLSAKRLEHMGADLLCMPCNTAHYFYDSLQDKSGVPIVNMIEETVKYIRQGNCRKAGLLATAATVQSGLYKKYADLYGIQLVTPDEKEQSVIMDLIYRGVKASDWSYDTGQFQEVLVHMEQAGAGCFILGCTELPIAFQAYRIYKTTVDPTLILARAVVTRAGYRLTDSAGEKCA